MGIRDLCRSPSAAQHHPLARLRSRLSKESHPTLSVGTVSSCVHHTFFPRSLQVVLGSFRTSQSPDRPGLFRGRWAGLQWFLDSPGDVHGHVNDHSLRQELLEPVRPTGPKVAEGARRSRGRRGAAKERCPKKCPQNVRHLQSMLEECSSGSCLRHIRNVCSGTQILTTSTRGKEMTKLTQKWMECCHVFGPWAPILDGGTLGARAVRGVDSSRSPSGPSSSFGSSESDAKTRCDPVHMLKSRVRRRERLGWFWTRSRVQSKTAREHAAMATEVANPSAPFWSSGASTRGASTSAV